MGGSNQSLFLLTALIVAQGSAAIPLLVVGLLLSWAAAPGWTELSLMWPDRIGGIAATCAEAFRRYNPVLANLTGVCYWWGWVPTCGLTAILASEAVHDWYLPDVPVAPLAITIVLGFTVLNLFGIGRTTAVVKVIAVGSGGLAFLSAIIPAVAGDVNIHAATTWNLTQPFEGVFGGVSGAMAGLYLIGFAAPAFEAATCHVGEMRDPVTSLPRAMLASAGMAGLYFLVLPMVWLGMFGEHGIAAAESTGLGHLLGPTFTPLLGAAGKSAAIWFMVLNMLHGTVQPLAGAARTLSQLADDGLLPRTVGRRNRFDTPFVATGLTAALAIVFLLAGDPVWMIAAANFTYLIGIAMPSIAVWLLRRNYPERHRPFRAPRGTIGLGVAAAAVWLSSTVLGFRQFGLPVVLFGLALAYSGSAAYAWRRYRDRVASGRPRLPFSLHFKLTGAMLAVMALDGAGYLLAVANSGHSVERTAVLEDIFVAVAILTITVGLVLPGIVAHSVTQVAEAADKISTGTLADLTRAMQALGRGELDDVHPVSVAQPVEISTRDEVGAMGVAFNQLLAEIERSVVALDHARRALRTSSEEVNARTGQLEHTVERLRTSQASLAEAQRLGGVGNWDFNPATGVLHWSDQMYRLWGLDPATVTATYESYLAGQHPDDREQVADVLRRSLADLEPYEMAHRVQWDDGTIRWLHCFGSVSLADGQLVMYGTAQDITEARLAEEALARKNAEDLATRKESEQTLLDALEQQRSATERLRNLDQMRNEVVATVSHELRTPLTSIGGYLELLLDDELPDGHRRMLETVNRNAERLSDLVEDLLSLARLDADIARLPSDVVDFAALVGDAVESVRQIMTQRDQSLHLHVPDDLNVPVVGDPRQLDRAVVNVLANAAKYTPTGGRVSVRLRLDDGHVSLAISDTGVGIPRDEQDKLFDRFFRASTAAAVPGTGLGLSIVKSIVDRHDGRLVVNSEPGHGSTFTFIFPVARRAVVGRR